MYSKEWKDILEYLKKEETSDNHTSITIYHKNVELKQNETNDSRVNA